ELLAVAAVARDPRDLGLVAALVDRLAAGLTDRGERVVVDLAAGYRRHLVVEQLDQETRHPGFGLAALAQEDDVLAGEDRVLDLRQHAFLVADDAPEESRALLEPRDQVVAQLLLHRLRLIPARSQPAARSRFAHSGTMWPRATRCQFIGSPRTAGTQPRDVL